MLYPIQYAEFTPNKKLPIRAVLDYHFHALPGGTQVFACLAGEHLMGSQWGKIH